MCGGKEKEPKEQSFDKIKGNGIPGVQGECMGTPANSKGKDKVQITQATGWAGNSLTKGLFEVEAQHLCLRLAFVPGSRQLWPAEPR